MSIDGQAPMPTGKAELMGLYAETLRLQAGILKILAEHEQPPAAFPPPAPMIASAGQAMPADPPADYFERGLAAAAQASACTRSRP